jgi:Ca2+-binding RTX toxin-like protein
MSLISSITRLFTRKTTSPAAAQTARRTFALEAMEGRLTPAHISFGTLVINGTAGHDNVVVSPSWGSIMVVENGYTQHFSASQITAGKISFKGNAGDDYFRNDTSLKSTVSGGDGNDWLVGGSAHDFMDGGLGEDYLYGMGGADTLRAGFDYSYNEVYGGDGDDLLYGGYGADWLDGMSGNDDVYGNLGNDWLLGGLGDDDLRGDDGHDWMVGGDGNDYMIGGYGNDAMYGNNGNDILYGEEGDDKLDGGAGWDGAEGGLGWDTFYNIEEITG